VLSEPSIPRPVLTARGAQTISTLAERRAYYTRVVVAPIVLGMVGFLLSAEAASVPSATPSSALRIDCAALDLESRSALEARARAEIVLTPRPAGTVIVVCRERSAQVDWLPAGPGRAQQRVVALEGTAPGVTVDRLLDAVHELRLGGDVPGAGSPTAAPAAPTRTAAPAIAVDVGTVAAPRTARRVRFGVAAAARAELWEGAITGGVAGEVGLRLASRAGWSFSVAAAIGRGAESAQGIQARTLGASVAAQHPIAAGFELAIGGEWRQLVATRPGEARLEQHYGGTFGGFAALRYVLSRGRFSFAAGPDLAVLAAPIAVDLGASELFRIPRLLAGLSVTGAADILR